MAEMQSPGDSYKASRLSRGDEEASGLSLSVGNQQFKKAPGTAPGEPWRRLTGRASN